MLQEKEMFALADKLIAGRRSGKPMDVAGDLAGLSEYDAYLVQNAVSMRMNQAGDPMVGWKIALTLPLQYEPLKLSGPVYALVFKSGVRLSGSVFEKGYPLKPGIEPELVVRISKDTDTSRTVTYTAESIRDHIGQVFCGMELVDNRYVDVTKMSGPARIADNVLQAALVIGTEVKDWQKLDFAALKGRSLLDGKELASGPGSAVMGAMPISLAWLANKLNEGGWGGLKTGDLVLTGSVHPPAFLPGPGVARTEFEGLGGTEITIK